MTKLTPTLWVFVQGSVVPDWKLSVKRMASGLGVGLGLGVGVGDGVGGGVGEAVGVGVGLGEGVGVADGERFSSSKNNQSSRGLGKCRILSGWENTSVIGAVVGWGVGDAVGVGVGSVWGLNVWGELSMLDRTAATPIETISVRMMPKAKTAPILCFIKINLKIENQATVRLLLVCEGYVSGCLFYYVTVACLQQTPNSPSSFFIC